MTAIPATAEFHHFAISTVCICVPCYLLIGSLNTQSGIDWWERHSRRFFHLLGRSLACILALLNYHPIWARKYDANREQARSEYQRRHRPIAYRSQSADQYALHARSTFNGMPQLSPRRTDDTIPHFTPPPPPPPTSPGVRDRFATFPPVRNQSARSSTIKFGPPRKSETFRETSDLDDDLPSVESPTALGSREIPEEKLESLEECDPSGNETSPDGSIFSRIFKKRKGSKPPDGSC